jgi:HAE1 family hydrophobic/amphiphilic exporter-1
VKLSDVSIRRPVFAAMLILGMVVLGLVSLGRLEIQLDPDIEFPIATVSTELRGASPETVEREVTDVLEEQFNSIEGIRTLSSTSSPRSRWRDPRFRSTSRIRSSGSST